MGDHIEKANLGEPANTFARMGGAKGGESIVTD
jgi:hypothetical protein